MGCFPMIPARVKVWCDDQGLTIGTIVQPSCISGTMRSLATAVRVHGHLLHCPLSQV